MKGCAGSPAYSAKWAGSLELAILGAAWISIAATMLCLAVVTPLVGALLFLGERAGGTVAALVVGVMAATVPVSLAVAGGARLRSAVALARQPELEVPSRTIMADAPAVRPAAPVGPTGRALPEVAIGRFGAAVFRQLPGDARVRRCGDRFEFHVDGEWIPFDQPQRFGQDPALRVVPGPEESNFVAKVYAAIVTTPGDIDEKPGCAILRPDQILPFLAGMPLREMPLRKSDDPLSALVA